MTYDFRPTQTGNLERTSARRFPLAEATTANQVPGWDSLSHVKIICAVEKEFGIRFKSLEVVRLSNVGQLQELVDKKIGKSVA